MNMLHRLGIALILTFAVFGCCYFLDSLLTKNYMKKVEIHRKQVEAPIDHTSNKLNESQYVAYISSLDFEIWLKKHGPKIKIVSMCDAYDYKTVVVYELPGRNK